ncbi:hypothetical protein ACIXWW_23560 [Bacteroides fragilis]
MHVDPFGVIAELAALEKETERYGQGGEEKIFHRHQADLSGDTGEVHPCQVPVARYVIFEPVQVQYFPDPFVSLLQFGIRPVEDTDRKEGAHQHLVLLEDLCLELVQLFKFPFDALVHGRIAPVNVYVACDPGAQPLVSLEIDDLVDDVVVGKVHA